MPSRASFAAVRRSVEREARSVGLLGRSNDMTPGDGLRPGFLANLDPSLTELIRQRAVVHHYPSGGMIVEANGRWTGIMLSGMARVFLRTPGGRQVTLRYARQGGSIGIASLLGGDTVSAPAGTAGFGLGARPPPGPPA